MQSKGYLCFIRNWEFFKSGTEVRAYKGNTYPANGYPDPKYTHKVCELFEWSELKKEIEKGRWYS